MSGLFLYIYIATQNTYQLQTNAVLCLLCLTGVAGGNDFQWCFSQVKGAIDEDVAEGM